MTQSRIQNKNTHIFLLDNLSNFKPLVQQSIEIARASFPFLTSGSEVYDVQIAIVCVYINDYISSGYAFVCLKERFIPFYGWIKLAHISLHFTSTVFVFMPIHFAFHIVLSLCLQAKNRYPIKQNHNMDTNINTMLGNELAFLTNSSSGRITSKTTKFAC